MAIIADAGGAGSTSVASTSANWGQFYAQGSMPITQAAPAVPSKTYTGGGENVYNNQINPPYTGGGENVYYGGQQLNVDPLTDFVTGLTALYGQPSVAPTSMNLAGGIPDYTQYGLAPTGMNVQPPTFQTETFRTQESRYTGREYYQGGSEQAYLGPIYQTMADFGILSTADQALLGFHTADNPSYVLNPAQVRVLGNYGIDETMLADLYTYDPDTGFWFLDSWVDQPNLSGGYGGGYTSGYSRVSGGGGGGSNYSYAPSGGLINWRIGL